MVNQMHENKSTRVLQFYKPFSSFKVKNYKDYLIEFMH